MAGREGELIFPRANAIRGDWAGQLTATLAMAREAVQRSERPSSRAGAEGSDDCAEIAAADGEYASASSASEEAVSAHAEDGIAWPSIALRTIAPDALLARFRRAAFWDAETADPCFHGRRGRRGPAHPEEASNAVQMSAAAASLRSSDSVRIVSRLSSWRPAITPEAKFGYIVSFGDNNDQGRNRVAVPSACYE